MLYVRAPIHPSLSHLEPRRRQEVLVVASVSCLALYRAKTHTRVGLSALRRGKGRGRRRVCGERSVGAAT
eukprot:723711-Alexandrium_andersonii.AAC.1